jgi:hypothetical protein
MYILKFTMYTCKEFVHEKVRGHPKERKRKSRGIAIVFADNQPQRRERKRPNAFVAKRPCVRVLLIP